MKVKSLMMKSYPVGQGNHNNIHYILRSANAVFKLCCFPEIEKIYIMLSSCKNKDDINTSVLCSDMKAELLNKWGVELIANSNNLFKLRFDKTSDLLASKYYINSL